MTETRYGREFGKGTFLGDSGDRFVNKPLDVQVREMGWSHACPVVDKVAREFTPEWTLRRYSECNFVFGLVVESAKDLNPALHKLLTTSVPRLKGERPGKKRIDPNFIPENFSEEMSPMSTPWGYAIPRVLIEEIGRGKDNCDRTQERILGALDVIDRSVLSSTTTTELLAKLAESVSNMHANPKAVLSHTLSVGILKEEGCKTIFKEIKEKINIYSPTLSKTYNSMSPSVRSKNDIINF